MEFTTAEELLALCGSENITIADVMRRRESTEGELDSCRRISHILQHRRKHSETCDRPYSPQTTKQHAALINLVGTDAIFCMICKPIKVFWRFIMLKVVMPIWGLKLKYGCIASITLDII